MCLVLWAHRSVKNKCATNVDGARHANWRRCHFHIVSHRNFLRRQSSIVMNGSTSCIFKHFASSKERVCASFQDIGTKALEMG